MKYQLGYRKKIYKNYKNKIYKNMPQKVADKPNRQVEMSAHHMRRGTRIKAIKEILRNFYVFFARR